MLKINFLPDPPFTDLISRCCLVALQLEASCGHCLWGRCILNRIPAPSIHRSWGTGFSISALRQSLNTTEAAVSVPRDIKSSKFV